VPAPAVAPEDRKVERFSANGEEVDRTVARVRTQHLAQWLDGHLDFHARTREREAFWPLALQFLPQRGLGSFMIAPACLVRTS
jgi:hypothetical protein